MSELQTLDWDSVIDQDGAQFVLLDEGEYSFTIQDFKRAIFPGSQKIQQCPKAELTLDIEGMTTVKTDLILAPQLMWKLAAFARSIGVKKHGEACKIPWDSIVGYSGRCKIKHRSYIDKNGESKTTNEVDSFLDPVNDAVFNQKTTSKPKAEVKAKVETANTTNADASLVDDILGI
jgi:hypothetical protein